MSSRLKDAPAIAVQPKKTNDLFRREWIRHQRCAVPPHTPPTPD